MAYEKHPIHMLSPTSKHCNQVQNILKSLNKTTCKDIYWYIRILDNYNYDPDCITKRTKLYPDFSTAHKNIWVRIFKLPFKTVDTISYKLFSTKFCMKLYLVMIGCSL